MMYRYWLAVLILLPSWLMADACRLEDDEAVELARNRISQADMVVMVCGHCGKHGPVPLRVRKLEFRHFAPEIVSVPFYEETFSIAALEEAEQRGTGELADTLRTHIEKDYKYETGYLPNDPYLVREKRSRYRMLLDFARQDYEMRVWDELLINDRPVDPAQLYYPVGNDMYRSLGIEVGCDIYRDAPPRVFYRPVARDPARIAPPEPYIADITRQCYDGSCPASEWTALSSMPCFDQAGGEQIGVIDTGTVVKPLKTLSYVSGARAVAHRDHDQIFEGDIFYLLDSQAEGYYRFWHYGNVFIDDAGGVRIGGSRGYCEREQNCWADAEALPGSIWWSEVKLRNGETVWVRDPLQTFSGVLVD